MTDTYDLQSLNIDVALTVPETEAEGPGKRFALWVQGCPFRCKGCCNPHMLKFGGGTPTTVSDLLERVLATDTEGVSFLGGEPFSHAKGLYPLARELREHGRTVMIYTGNTLAELKASQDPYVHLLLGVTDLLVDGRYEEGQRTLTRRWVGSDNQVMHFLTDRYKPTDPQFSASNTVEFHLRKGILYLNGWPLTGANTRPDKP